ncbi:MAG: AAA family ATPase [Bacteroidota bacterium]
MKKIMVIGCGGSGKSTLSKKLHAITGLELIHLDQIFWKPGWVELPKEEWIKKNKQILAEKPYWILDGNYSSTMDMRINKADTIIFMDTPTVVRLFRVIKRVVQNFGRSRPDMPANCPERISFQFLHYILFYNLTRRPVILKKLEMVRDKKNVYIISDKKSKLALLKKVEDFFHH